MPRDGKRRIKGEGGYSYDEETGMHEFSAELLPDPITGKRRRVKKRGKDQAETLVRFNEAKRLIQDGFDPTVVNKETLAGWLTFWLSTIVKVEKKPKTYVSYEHSVRKHIIPALGDKLKLKEMRPEHVREMHREIHKKFPPKGSPPTAKKAHEVLSAGLTSAVAHERTHRNVASLVPKPTAESNREAFTVAEVEKIFNYCIQHDPANFARWATAFLTGSRQSEVLGLQWSKVDLRTKMIQLDSQLQTLTKSHGCTMLNELDDKTGKNKWSCTRQRGYACPDWKWDTPPGMRAEHIHNSMVLTNPKSKAGIRMIPIAAPLAAALQQHKALYARPNEWDLLFTEVDKDGNVRPVTTVHDQRAWKAMLEKAGVRHLPLHSARHTTATLLANAGIDIDIIMSIIGHSQILATKGYVHLDQSVKAKALDTAFGGMFSLSS
nr:tyrosine-type recombinase/integrase [Rhodococcus sp. (in: high G+C Gram-positive bacteria)]